ncbi:zf-HC2 domain-containing protein [Actinomadura graeca]|uniref:Zf-HC2 domain-containing protein n=1 Tax=Actinomadura graeca TaxID=2750812 RepID=A0ABX8QSJ1_9ACTN|nr:zf-HC2 domain-containing protein [Actinomadura graeca]QXJ21707.1 zf-HC2 domain-containing protein [Actinomadura graeca]
MGPTDCGAYRLGLGVYALGRLAGAEADALSDHLTGCPRCRAELAELRGVADVLARTLPVRRTATRGTRAAERSTRLSGVCAYGARGRGRSR